MADRQYYYESSEEGSEEEASRVESPAVVHHHADDDAGDAAAVGGPESGDGGGVDDSVDVDDDDDDDDGFVKDDDDGSDVDEIVDELYARHVEEQGTRGQVRPPSAKARPRSAGATGSAEAQRTEYSAPSNRRPLSAHAGDAGGAGKAKGKTKGGSGGGGSVPVPTDALYRFLSSHIYYGRPPKRPPSQQQQQHAGSEMRRSSKSQSRRTSASALRTSQTLDKDTTIESLISDLWMDVPASAYKPAGRGRGRGGGRGGGAAPVARSRPTSRLSSTPSRPRSRASGVSTSELPSIALDLPGGKAQMAKMQNKQESAHAEYCRRLIAEANHFADNIGADARYELYKVHHDEHRVKVTDRSGRRLLRDISFEMFHREHAKLHRSDEQHSKETQRTVSAMFVAAKNREDPEQNSEDVKRAMRELLLDTMELTSKLEDQVYVLSQRPRYQQR